jgi:hypothetical protein
MKEIIISLSVPLVFFVCGGAFANNVDQKLLTNLKYQTSSNSSSWHGNGHGGNTGVNPSVNKVPVPNALFLTLIGFVGLIFVRTKKRIITFLAILLLIGGTSVAFAQSIPLIPTLVDQGINLSGSNQAASSSWSWSNSNSNATGGDAVATNMGNNQNVNFQYGGGTHERNAPAVFMGSLFPTAPCQGTANGFLSAFVFGGVGGGMSFTLEQCEIREEARVAYGIGQPEIAKEILCMAKYASQTKFCKKEESI